MRRIGLALLAAAALSAGSVAAKEGTGGLKLDGGLLSVHGIVSYYWVETGYGLGARYQIPLVPRGLLKLRRIKDDLALDAGIDFVKIDWGRLANGWEPIDGYTYADFTYSAFIPTVGVLWNFWLTPQLAVYPKVDAGFAIGWWSADFASGFEPDMNHFFIQGAAGCTYRMGRFALKGEVGTGMLKLGAQYRL